MNVRRDVGGVIQVKRTTAVISVALGCVLAACGGGGGASPGPVPTVAPAAHQVSFAVTPLGTAPKISSSTRTVKGVSCSSLPSSVELQAINPSNAPPSGLAFNYFTGQSLTATEFDSACNVIAGTPVYVFADPTIASTNIPTWTPPFAAPPAPTISVSGFRPGSTTVTATFLDGASASTIIGVYGTMGVSCDESNFYVYDGTDGVAKAGWSATDGYVTLPNLDACNVNANPPYTTADMQVSGDGRGVAFQYGYQIVSTGLVNGAGPLDALHSITSCTSFASQGTVLPSSILSGPQITAMLFKTHDGRCVKFASLPNEQTVSGFSGGVTALVGYDEISDTNGIFAY